MTVTLSQILLIAFDVFYRIVVWSKILSISAITINT